MLLTAGGDPIIASSTHRKFNRGASAAFKHITSKGLKGKVQHEQKLQNKALKEAKLVYEWLKPTEAGYVEAEGLEKTRQFKQHDIIQVIPPYPRMAKLSAVLKHVLCANRPGEWCVSQ